MKQLIIKLFAIAVLSVAPLLAFNIILDPHRVIRKNYESLYICPNERFVKVDYVLKHPDRYNAFLFGSSRVSQVPVGRIDAALGGRHYNMTFISGVVAEYLAVLELFLERGIEVKNVVVGIDYFSFKMLPLEGLVRNRMYPLTFRDKIDFYFTFLTLEPDTSILKEIKFDGKDARYDLTGSGGYEFVRRERKIDENPAAHLLKFRLPIFTVCIDRLDKTTAELRAMAELCRSRGIPMTVFINPVNLGSYLCEDVDFMNEVRKRIAGITGFWDFSGYNSVTADDMNYVDIIHFRKKIGGLMVERMFGSSRGVPADFGLRVTQANVEAYTEKAKREHALYKKRIKPPCMPCVSKR